MAITDEYDSLAEDFSSLSIFKNDEIQFEEMLGQGTFGSVYRAIVKKADVAIKMFLIASNTFFTEVQYLLSCNHSNIIKLIGIVVNSTDKDACFDSERRGRNNDLLAPIGIVMEYMENGNLYELLHESDIAYTASNCISWALQCASALAYLHSIKPRCVVHRDIKPLNMLLGEEGLALKICDFGTASQVRSQMTNSRGSAAWMAPEVFTSQSYSEKCDVFSWSIILWEMLTRRKPFEEIGGPAYRVMWAIHKGVRPASIIGCPKPIEVLMRRCWQDIPGKRPTIKEVEYIIQNLFIFFPKPTPLNFNKMYFNVNKEVSGKSDSLSSLPKSEGSFSINVMRSSSDLKMRRDGTALRVQDMMPYTHTAPELICCELFKNLNQHYNKKANTNSPPSCNYHKRSNSHDLHLTNKFEINTGVNKSAFNSCRKFNASVLNNDASPPDHVCFTDFLSLIQVKVQLLHKLKENLDDLKTRKLIIKQYSHICLQIQKHITSFKHGI